MNRNYLFVYLICIFSFLYIHCGGDATLTVPNVTHAVTDSGLTISLAWDEVNNAEGYIIYGNGIALDTVQTLYCDVDTPVALIEVKAYAGSQLGDADQVNCIPVTTYSLQIWGASDTISNHLSGLSFGSEGQAEPITINDSAYYHDLDYIFEDRLSFTTGFEIFSPNAYSPPYNTKNNMSVRTNAIYFDSLSIAYAPSSCSTRTALEANSIYTLFLDQDNDGWDSDSDHFGKMEVSSITGDSTQPHTAIISVAWQPIAGLRWVVTP